MKTQFLALAGNGQIVAASSRGWTRWATEVKRLTTLQCEDGIHYPATNYIVDEAVYVMEEALIPTEW